MDSRFIPRLHNPPSRLSSHVAKGVVQRGLRGWEGMQAMSRHAIDNLGGPTTLWHVGQVPGMHVALKLAPTSVPCMQLGLGSSAEAPTTLEAAGRGKASHRGPQSRPAPPQGRRL